MVAPLDMPTPGVTGADWGVLRDSVADGIANTEQRLYRATDQQAETGNLVAGVATNWWDSTKKALEGPQTPPGQQLTTGQVVAQRVRQVQQIIGAVKGLLDMGQDMLNVGFASLTAPIAALFPSLPSATMGTMYLGVPHAHSHPPSLIPPAPPVPLPSLGPIMLGTCVRVLINSTPAARCGDIGVSLACFGIVPFYQIKTGSSNVFVGGNRAARVFDFCMVCSKADDDRKADAGKFLQAIGKAASAASTGLTALGYIAAGAGIAADLTEAAVEDDAAMSQAKAIAAGMGAAQLAADLAAKALTKAMGKDPGIPPAAMGAVLPGHMNVLIGGFPMINIPNPVEVLLNKLKRFAPAKPDADAHEEGDGKCPGSGGSASG